MKCIKDGVSVSPGYLRGVCRVLESEDDIVNVEPGDIVVLPYSHPMFTLALFKAGAVICENGGKLSHICIVAMEMGIPCITKVTNATKLLKSGQDVLVNTSNREIVIYE